MATYVFYEEGTCHYTRTLTVEASSREEALGKIALGSGFAEEWEYDDENTTDTWDDPDNPRDDEEEEDDASL